MTDRPKFIVTVDNKVYRFNAWYMFSTNGILGTEWPGAQVTDKDGKSFGIPMKKIKTKIYEMDANNMIILDSKE